MQEPINICYITDENYSLPTATSILSIIESAKSNINIYILTNGVSEDIINYFNSLSSSNIKIIVKNAVVDFINENVKEHIYVSKTSLLKFKIPQYFQELDKILYLDSDTLIAEDLAELYDTDISECYAGVISDFDGVERNNHLRLNLDTFFNSGVMLLNLKKLREDDITQKLIDYKNNRDCAHFMDQDAFNVVLYNSVLYLNPTYNMMLPNLKNCDTEKFALHYGISIDKAKELLYDEKYCVLHLTNKAKPWNSIGTEWFNLWFYFFRKIDLPRLKCYFYDNFIQMSHKQLVVFFNNIVNLYNINNANEQNKKIDCE